MFKRCPLCNRFVWFWQSKCYLDAKSKKPCHTDCWLWNMMKDEASSGYIKRPQQEIVIPLKEGDWRIYRRKDEVEKVDDDSWRKDEVEKVDDDSWRKDVEK